MHTHSVTPGNTEALLRRLNPFCAQALEQAAALCQTRAHGEITPEHWLLKLLEGGEGDITVIARRYEWDMEAIWQALLAYLEQLPRTLHARPKLAQRVTALLQAAWLTASLEAGEPVIRSVHLLQALINQPAWLKTENLWPLLTLTVTQLERLRPLLDNHSQERPDMQALSPAPNLLTTTQGAVTDSAPGAKADASPTTSTPIAAQPALAPALQALLDRFTQDLTHQAREGAIDPVLGRETEIRQMIDILCRRRKNNPILVGEPGTGKTALVEGLALQITAGNVPASLKNVSVRVLDLGLMQAGAGVKGEFEQRLKNVITAVQSAPNPILLFIDEAHTLIGAGNQAGGSDAANLLKPALARGALRTIAATTWSEYKQYFEQDAALERRFQVVKVDEPDDNRASLMLRGLKSRYARHHGVHIEESAVLAAVTLSRRYLTGRQLPDKAVDLLDTAAARVRISLDTLPHALVQLNAQIDALDREQAALEQDQQWQPHRSMERLDSMESERSQLAHQHQQLDSRYQQEKALAEEIIALRQQQQERKQESHTANIEPATRLPELLQTLTALQGTSPLLSLDVDARSVAAVVADWTGIPLNSLLKDEQSALLQLEQQLGQRVIGQQEALAAIARRLRAAKTGLTADRGPLAVFLLVGPSGVGKTETALVLADRLFGGQQSLITINLSEYQESHTVSQLKGSPPGYVGYGQGGVLTEAVRQRPYSVVLLDEVEKAHRDVLTLFYQVFDRGFMRDGEGREIDFRNTVILMTTNLGSDLLMAQLEETPETPTAQLHELLRPVLRDHFQPALLARFQTLLYRPLGATALRAIVEIKLAQVTQRLQRHYGLPCTIEETLYDTLVSACLLPDSGARNIDSLLNEQILPILAQALLARQASGHQASGVSLGFDQQEGITLSFTELTE